MKRTKRILLAAGFALLLAISWIAAITAKSDSAIQKDLLEQAAAFTEDEVYIRAIPLLEEAAGYDAKRTLEAETALKDAYIHMGSQVGYSRKYEDLLDKQMARKDAAPEVFLEAGQHYLDVGRHKEAFAVLRDGIAKTGSEELVKLYEDNRYMYRMERMTYHDVGSICNGSVQVELDGMYGLANKAGNLLIPCEYDRVSTYDNGMVAVRKGKVITMVDINNNRLALLHEPAEDFGSFGSNRLTLKVSDGWHLATSEFSMGSVALEELGMFSEGVAAAKLNGKWGLVESNGADWRLEPAYDEIIMDELGRAFAQNVAFVRKDDKVFLISEGEQIAGPFEAAHPFQDGWAAVKKDGKWGYIDSEGTEMLPFQYEDALSFGQHLAAVKKGDNWGYISKDGKMVIEPQFIEAKSFYGGSAPVRIADGWRFITLVEYEKGASL